MTQFTAGETSMYEETTPPSQELKKLELPSHPTLIRSATVPPSNVIRQLENNEPSTLRPYASNLELTNERKHSRDDSGEISTDSAESTSTTGPPTHQNSFSRETKRRTIGADKTQDTIAGSGHAFVTAHSIASESSTSVNNLLESPLDETTLVTTSVKELSQPIPSQTNSASSGPDWSAHPNAWGYLQSLNKDYPSRYLERNGKPEPDVNQRAGYMIGRSDRCELSIEHPFVSQRHCLIYILWQSSSDNENEEIKLPVRPTVIIEDMSRNGTFINGQSMERGSRQVLNNGDHIQLYRRAAFEETDPRQQFFKIVLSPDLVEPTFEESYDLGKTLGEGNFAKVYVAIERETRRKFAVKIIQKRRFASKPKLLASLRKEIAVLMGLPKHECIMSVEKVFEDSDLMYLVLELGGGGDLFEYVYEKQRLPEAEARLLFWQLLVGLDYLHSNNVVHRDLKLENVLFEDKKGLRIKIGDFGLATFSHRHFALTSRCGTPSYVAPEVLAPASSRAYGKEVDLWSLGVMLYICLCGYPPFYADASVPAQAIRSGQFTFVEADWKNVTKEAKDLVSRLMTVDPAKRITVTEAMFHNWLTMELPGEADIDPAVIANIRSIFSSQRATMQETQTCTAPFGDTGDLTSEDEG
ncbi:kinase-like domain-containing protein [Umbelopsis sp. AD052]|nr:kinase-like domain-containing protein [Umbelopsis sp. AD052]